MRVGVFIEQEITVGGGFQQAFSVINLLNSNPLENIEYIFFVFTEENKIILEQNGINAVLIDITPKINLKNDSSIKQRLKKFLQRHGLLYIPPVKPEVWKRDILKLNKLDELLEKNKIDLAYFLTPSTYAMGIKKIPYIYTVWDQCQRDWPEFPEVRSNFQFEFRELNYSKSCPKAIAVLVDSEQAKRDLSFHYRVDLNRIHVAPFFPLESDNLKPDNNVMNKFNIKRPFIFYPAQLWPHKNHRYIIEALKILKDSGTIIDAVFTGSEKGNGEFLKDFTKKLNLEDQIHFLGFVERSEIIGFYNNALALVMPTYLGHTNIPPLEAFLYNCPVCYSDLPDLREQVGEAAFLMNLNDPNSLVEILKLISNGENKNKNIVQEKIKLGHEQLKKFSAENYLNVLKNIFENYMQIKKCWS